MRGSLRGGGSGHRQPSPADAEPAIAACIGTRDAQVLADRFAGDGATICLPLRSMPYGCEFQVCDLDGHRLAFFEAAGGAV
ncbi:MAG: hypothetical protein JSS03_09965 [Proteobacteria bacterium]|nr:hypothetical protein [Pseudomonadota bacterium]